MPDAVALALRNAEYLGIANVTISQSDWFSELDGQRFATIVSNPPISTRRRPASRRKAILRFEPLTALVAGDQGWPIWRISSARDGEYLAARRFGCCWSMAGLRARRFARCSAKRTI